MNILQVPFLLFFFFSSVHSKKHCPTSYCGSNNSFPIQYPFKLPDQQPPNCSYTELKCNNQGISVLNLPYSGDFYVRNIDYGASVITLYDPENCLPRRFMNLNLSFSYPLEAIYYQNYTFYSCPPELMALSNLTVIDCLSNSSSAAVATSMISSQVMKKLYRCNEIANVIIPVSGLDSSDYIGNQSDFILQWFSYSCNGCSKKTVLVPEYVLGAVFIMVYLMTFIMPPLICIACCVHFTKEVRSEAGVNKSTNRSPS